jgi:hypothetical protein
MKMKIIPEFYSNLIFDPTKLQTKSTKKYLWPQKS